MTLFEDYNSGKVNEYRIYRGIGQCSGTLESLLINIPQLYLSVYAKLLIESILHYIILYFCFFKYFIG